MKSCKKIVLSMLLVAIMIIQVAIPVQTHAVAKLNKTAATLSVGDTLQLKVSGSKSKVSWSTNNKKVATVNQSGKVTAKSKGTVNIIGKIGSSRLNCKINVKEDDNSKNRKRIDYYYEGQYKVGIDIPKGEYVIFANSDHGYFCLSSDSNKEDIITNGNFDYNAILTIKEEEYLDLSNAYAIPIDKVKDFDTEQATMFKIGNHIPAGEYKLITEENGYYCVYNDGRQQDIEANDNFKNSSYVKVKEGQYLELSRCKILK